MNIMKALYEECCSWIITKALSEECCSWLLQKSYIKNVVHDYYKNLISRMLFINIMKTLYEECCSWIIKIMNTYVCCLWVFHLNC